MSGIFLFGVAIDQDIVEVYGIESIEVFKEGVINILLETPRGPGEAEIHYKRLV